VFSRSSDWKEQIAKGYLSSEEAYRGFLWDVRDVSICMRSVPKPIIAAVNGLATMGGFELALSCDFIVASQSARMGDGHASGVGGGGGSQRLMELLGARATRWMLYTEEVMSAQRAYELGIVQQVYPDASFDADVLKLAQGIASRRIGRSLERIKILTAGTEPTLQSLNVEMDHSIAHWLSPAVDEWRAKFVASDGGNK
jgi:enoyl-CoA hydratase/carnithine racemase